MLKMAYPPPSLNEFFELRGRRKRSGAFHSSVQAKGTVAWDVSTPIFSYSHYSYSHMKHTPKALMVNSTKIIICSKPLKI
jgi:hypothetical protein